mgnify:FL=1
MTGQWLASTRYLLSFGALACSSAAGGEPGVDEIALMNRIEALVELPEKAKPLNQYSRNYALAEAGNVIAVYFLPIEIKWDDLICLEPPPDFNPRSCTPEEISEWRRQEDEAAARRAKRGASRWFSSVDDLPYIFDGGCGFIEVVYDPAIDRIVSVQCNGYA